jgi:dTDP-4-dehydrorhamnose 3,5-epimerase
LIDGLRVRGIKKNVDERGYFAELLREDWKDFLGNDRIVEFSLSHSNAGVIRAWHRHGRGQNDYVLCIRGSIKECVFDDRSGSATRGELDELVLDGSGELQIARIVGACWHGYMVVGRKPAMVLYGVTQLYDYGNPDEQRRPWKDKAIVPTSINGRAGDPRNGKPYDWKAALHK